MQVSGKTILLTGGTDGIGRELALQLKSKGAHVVVTGRTRERIDAAKAAGFETILVDLATKAGVDSLVASMANRPFDILINNAGVGTTHDFREGAPDLAENDACVFLNINAPIHLITQFMPMLRTRPEAIILNVTSGLAIAPNAGSAVYCATKAALRSYTMALREQLRGTSIHVIEGLPPLVDTKMTAGRGSNKMAPQDCAAAFVRAIETNAREANVGQVKLLRRVYSLSPALARRIMLRF
jgi:uncharacterized oxidoreductase